jgi:hypothetical protein
MQTCSKKKTTFERKRREGFGKERSDQMINMEMEKSNLNFLEGKRERVAIDQMLVAKSVNEQNYMCHELVW